MCLKSTHDLHTHNIILHVVLTVLTFWNHHSLDDLQQFLANDLPDSDIQIGLENSLNEGTAYTAAEFFLGNRIENLLNAPTPAFNGTVGFAGATFYSQGPFCSPIIDSQSLEVNRPFNDSSSGSMEHINVESEMLTAPFGNFVSEPDNMDIFSERLPNMAEDQSLYTLEFNTQFLHWLEFDHQSTFTKTFWMTRCKLIVKIAAIEVPDIVWC